MVALTNKPEMGSRLYSALINLASSLDRGVDYSLLLQHLAGVLVETFLVFDEPDTALQAGFKKLSHDLSAAPMAGDLWAGAIAPSHIVDCETERGRTAARLFFEDWMDCAYEFHALVSDIAVQCVLQWEGEEGIPRAETLRLLYEYARLAMSYEIAAQELCDIAIELHVGRKNWTLGDCISALSAVAGRRLAISLNSNTCMIFKGSEIPDNLDQIVYVMTKEAVRLGVPAGGDWRFGLAANDMPINAPVKLIEGMEPVCDTFFSAIALYDNFDQAVACAKAAGRMIAVATGGELPEIEPAIAKPLAMAAMSESYKYVCMDYKSAIG
ncbi:MAG: hypothetical protein ACK4VI_06955 [Alphaproteobacteria bacterium]